MANLACDTNEPRGAGILLTGLCTLCGMVTTNRNTTTGRPQHHQTQTKPQPITGRPCEWETLFNTPCQQQATTLKRITKSCACSRTTKHHLCATHAATTLHLYCKNRHCQ